MSDQAAVSVWKTRTAWVGVLAILGSIIKGVFYNGEVFEGFGSIDWQTIITGTLAGLGTIYMRSGIQKVEEALKNGQD